MITQDKRDFDEFVSLSKISVSQELLVYEQRPFALIPWPSVASGRIPYTRGRCKRLAPHISAINTIWDKDKHRCISPHDDRSVLSCFNFHQSQKQSFEKKFRLNRVNPDNIFQIMCIYFGLYSFPDASRYYTLHTVIWRRISTSMSLVSTSTSMKEFRILLAFGNVIVGLPGKIDDRTVMTACRRVGILTGWRVK